MKFYRKWTKGKPPIQPLVQIHKNRTFLQAYSLFVQNTNTTTKKRGENGPSDTTKINKMTSLWMAKS